MNKSLQQFCFDSRYTLWILLAIAFVLRFWGIHWGLPHAYHPDERLLVARAIHFFTGDFNPHLFIYPSLLMYILFLANALVFGIGGLFGISPPVAQLATLYHQDPTIFYLINRFVIILFGVLTVWSTFKIADTVFGRKTALLAAFLLAILPVHVLHSHYVTTDVPGVFFLTVTFYFAIRILIDNHWKNYFLAGLFGGLAASVKYNAGLIVLCIVIAPLLTIWLDHPLRWRKNIVQSFKTLFSRRVLAAVSFSILVYLVTSPYTLLDFQTFIKDFMFQVTVQRRGHGLIFLAMGNKVVQHIWVNLQSWGGVLLWLLMLGGIVRSILKLDKYRALILFWIFLYFLAMLSSNDLFIRYSLPLAPFLMILAADWVMAAMKSSRTFSVLMGSMAFFAMVYMAVFSILLSKNMSLPDTRTQAKLWIEQNIARGSLLAIMQDATGMHDRDDPPLSEEDYRILRDRDLLKLFTSDPNWIVMSSFDFIDYLRIGARLQQTQSNYQALIRLQTGQTDYQLVRRFDTSPRLLGWNFLGKFPIHDMMYSYPTILIYQKATKQGP